MDEVPDEAESVNQSTSFTKQKLFSMQFEPLKFNRKRILTMSTMTPREGKKLSLADALRGKASPVRRNSRCISFTTSTKYPQNMTTLNN